MTDRELKKLSRADLLELLLQERRENKKLCAELKRVNEMLADKNIQIEQSGSLAEAALRLNGVFEAAEAAAEQYLENLRRRAEDQEQ